MTSPLRPGAQSLKGNGISTDPLSHLLALPEPSLDDMVEAMIAWTQNAVGTAEIVAASDRFNVENGKVFHDDTFYDTRTSYFFDHFLFERPLTLPSGHGPLTASATPYELFLSHARAANPVLPRSLIDRLAALGDFRHSTFKILKLQEKSMVVQDLLSPAKINITAKGQETFRGLDKRHLFQGFLFRIGDESHLSSGLVLHPARVGRLIRRFLKQGQKASDFSRRAALARLASLQIRYLRHRHVDPKTLYQADLR